MAEGNLAPESTPKVNPKIPEIKTSQEISRGSTPKATAPIVPAATEKPAGQAVEAVAPEAAEPAKLWYHCTSPEYAQSIKTTGLQGSIHGSLGPGVYISDKPIELAEPGRFEILILQLQKETKLLEVSWIKDTNPHKTITALYGKAGAKLYKKAAQLSGNDSWIFLQKLAADKGYDGFSWTNPMSGIKEVVIFDPKKLSLAKSPATEPVAEAVEATWEAKLADLADAVQDPTTTFQLREVIQQWHKHMDNIYLQRLGSIANANQAYKDGIQLLLKQRYPSGYIRVYRGGRSARGAHLNPLERAYTNVTTSRETAKNFQPANDAWNTLDIDNIIIRIEDVVSITSVKESELIIPGAVLKERIANPLTVAQVAKDNIYRQGKK